jgi:hypothetical protein
MSFAAVGLRLDPWEPRSGSCWTDRGKQKELAKVAKADVTEVAMNDAVLTPGVGGAALYRLMQLGPTVLLFTQDATCAALQTRGQQGAGSRSRSLFREHSSSKMVQTSITDSMRGERAAPSGEDFLWRLSAIVRTAEAAPLRAAAKS